MVAIQTASFFFASVALLTSYVNAYGQVAQIVDSENFCVFLPPTDSVNRGISDTEWNAQAFCLGDAPKATNAGKLNSGFILSAHYLVTDKYVQVTGQINPAKANLNTSDDGGQYDIKAPKGSSCAGWKYYVNLIEPTGSTFCVRCCNDDRTCNRGISEKGCAHIIPGDYSGPLGNKGSSIPTDIIPGGAATTISASSTKSAVVSTTKKATSTTSASYNPANTDLSDNTSSQAVVSDSLASGSSSTEMLEQNEKISGQSINGALSSAPTLITFSAVLLSLVMLTQQ